MSAEAVAEWTVGPAGALGDARSAPLSGGPATTGAGADGSTGAAFEPDPPFHPQPTDPAATARQSTIALCLILVISPDRFQPQPR
jgi:hypothetical protein